MFQWSRKTVKSVTFNPGISDESLLAQVESYLQVNPGKTFSDLCKESLWQYLCGLESSSPTRGTIPLSPEQKISELQRQVKELEQHFFARESHILQLSQQVAQLANMLNQGQSVVSPVSLGALKPSVPQPVPVEKTDPVIDRLSSLIDDF
ncbi:hypothetical protein NIES932_20470 [Raphidiopsis curvata NIES-932]|nr:hypothetical protein NIES932_20470 [Raphidiopsis curvata NIES-932]